MLSLASASVALAFSQSWNHNPDSPNGPLAWGFLGSYNAYATCGTQKQAVGAKQTPIAIVSKSAIAAELPKLQFHYEPTKLVVENLNHVVEVVNENAASYVKVGSSPVDQYKLLQFHFHTPSEHTIDGVAAEMEVHFVHQNALGELAVVGVMMKADDAKANHAFDKIFNNVPYLAFFSGANSSSPELGEFEPSELLPEVTTYFTYSGSLTTPPCSEGVHWFVLTEPVYVSRSAVSRYQQVLINNSGYAGNNRPLQPLNGRTVLVTK